MSASHPPLPDSYEGLLARAQSLWQAGDLEGASTAYRHLTEKLGRLTETVLDRRPTLRDMRRQVLPILVLLLRQQGRFAEAHEAQKTLVEIDPEHAGIWRRELATLRIAKGEVDAGLGELRALAEENPDDISNWLSLGAELRIEGRFAESQAALDQALQVVGDESGAKQLAQVHYQRFRLFEALVQVDEAVSAWEQMVGLDPEMSRTIQQVCTMLTKAGRYGDARRYAARDKNALQSGFQQGLIASLTGNPAEAKQTWRRVASLDPAQFEYGHEAWAEAVLRLGNPDPALERLPELLRRYGSARLLVLAGIAWAMRENREMAQRLLQQSIDALRRSRPAKQKLDSDDWRLFDSLVADEAVKSTLKPYFAVVETLWG